MEEQVFNTDEFGLVLQRHWQMNLYDANDVFGLEKPNPVSSLAATVQYSLTQNSWQLCRTELPQIMSNMNCIYYILVAYCICYTSA